MLEPGPKGIWQWLGRSNKVDAGNTLEPLWFWSLSFKLYQQPLVFISMSLIHRGNLIDLWFKIDNPLFNTKTTHSRTQMLRPLYNVINNVSQTQQGLGPPTTRCMPLGFPEPELLCLHRGLAFSNSGHSVHLSFSSWLPTTVHPSATQDLPQDPLVLT